MKWVHHLNGGSTVAVKAMTVPPNSSSTLAIITVLAASEIKNVATEKGGDCRFWMSEKGCRRGDRWKALYPKPKGESLLSLFRPQPHAKRMSACEKGGWR